MLTCQDVGRRIQTRKTQVKDYGPKIKAKDYGVSQIMSPDAAVLVSDQSSVLQIAYFNRHQT